MTFFNGRRFTNTLIQTLGSEGEKSFSLKTTLETYLIYKLHLTPLPLRNA